MPKQRIAGNRPPRRRLHLRSLDWPVVIGIVVVHPSCLAAPFYFSRSALVVACIFVWLTGAIGDAGGVGIAIASLAAWSGLIAAAALAARRAG